MQITISDVTLTPLNLCIYIYIYIFPDIRQKSDESVLVEKFGSEITVCFN